MGLQQIAEYYDDMSAIISHFNLEDMSLEQLLQEIKKNHHLSKEIFPSSSS
jgi:hypothetical protein